MPPTANEPFRLSPYPVPIGASSPPPKAAQGFHWEYRRGCDCENCPWRGNCRGHTTPHWIEVANG